jgi:hypothetical protein
MVTKAFNTPPIDPASVFSADFLPRRKARMVGK